MYRVEKDQIKNELMNEVLSRRAKTMDWWIFFMSLLCAGVGLSLGAAGIVFAISIKDKFKEFDSITEESRRYIEEMKISRTILRAIVFEEQNRNYDALKLWRSIAKKTEEIGDERAAEAWYRVGYIYCCTDVRDFEAAIEAYDKAIGLNPDEKTSYNNRAKAKTELGRHKEALIDADKAVRLDPNSTTYNTRGAILFKLGLVKEAIDDYNRAILIGPDFAETYSNRANASASLGRFKEAIDDYNEAIRLRPNYSEAYYNRALCWLDLGERKKAQDDLEAAHSLARATGNGIVVSLVEKVLAENFEGSSQ